MSESLPADPAVRHPVAFAALAFAATCLVPYSSLTLVGPSVAAVGMLAVWRVPGWTRWRFAWLAVVATFLGGAIYALFTDVFHALSAINVQARESARLDRLLGLGLGLDPNRMPIMFLNFEWVGGACFYAAVSGVIALVLRRRPSQPVLSR